MTIHPHELLEAAEIVAKEKNMQIALKYNAAAAAATGSSVFIFGLLAGPIGMAAGGLFGGMLSAIACSGKYKSVVEIIREDLTPQQREDFVDHLHAAVKDVGIEDGIQLATLLMSKEYVTVAVFEAVKLFVTENLKHELK